VFDLAVSWHGSWPSEHFGAIRDHFLAGYASRRPLPHNVLEQLDLFLLIRSLMLVSWREMRPDIIGNTQKALWMPKLVRDVQHALNNNRT
jgi:Ser/Thr protein kinase RdoA (MazF antagonist)